MKRFQFVFSGLAGRIVLSAVLLLSFLFFGCEETVPGPTTIISHVDTKTLHPDGGVLLFLNGDVTIDAPKGAVSYPVEISVEAGRKGDHKGLITRMIQISPELEFNTGVQVTINCMGDLQTCPWIGCVPVIYCWENFQDLTDRGPASRAAEANFTFINCTQYADGLVTFCMERTGVFAVGLLE